MIDDYHANGVALMVSAFGSTGQYSITSRSTDAEADQIILFRRVPIRRRRLKR